MRRAQMGTTMLLILALPSLSAAFSCSPLSFVGGSIFLLRASQRFDQEVSDAGAGVKARLLELLARTPSNTATPRALTDEVLRAVGQLEGTCPTEDAAVLSSLGGNWELMWTAQDEASPEWKLGPLRSWINPLENQAYSNNPSAPGGRANPILPRNLQEDLEKIGVIVPDDGAKVRSSQSVDIKRGRVRNVVAFGFPSFGKPRRASLTVDVRFRPNESDPRRVDVKFDSCRFVVQNSPVDVTLPLGLIGPTGWLRTAYIDDDIRITRGHKGSVFILSRSSTKKE